MEVEIEEAVSKKGTEDAEKKGVRSMRGTAKRKKYMDRWKEECRVDEVFDEVMGQKVEIRMKDLLVCSKPLWDLMFKGGIQVDEKKETEEGMQEASIGGLVLSEWAY